MSIRVSACSARFYRDTRPSPTNRHPACGWGAPEGGIRAEDRSHIDMTGRSSNSFPRVRMRRMRRDEFSRRLMRESRLTVDSLIYPVFIVEGSGVRQPVASMPGIERYSVDELVRECE